MAKSHQSVDWSSYFEGIKPACPWSYSSWQKGRIDIVKWQGRIQPLEDIDARIYLVNLNKRRTKKLALKLDTNDVDCEWLWSHPSFGPLATPVACLIQQDRAKLSEIRQKMSRTSG